jgi:sulfoxide reductase heme-binding subunit YedZ
LRASSAGERATSARLLLFVVSAAGVSIANQSQKRHERAMVRAYLAKLSLWGLLALPAAVIFSRLFAGEMLADQITETGEWSARLIIIALMLTPLLRLFPASKPLRWVIRHRRAFGVAGFAYALLHLIFYVIDMAAISDIIGEISAPAIWTAWLAFFCLLPPAFSSSDAAMRWLGRQWKTVQRLAYPAAIFTLIHWALVHDGLAEAMLHFMPLLILQLLRVSRLFTSKPFERKIV